MSLDPVAIQPDPIFIGRCWVGMWEMQCNQSLGFTHGRPGRGMDQDNCTGVSSPQLCNDGHPTRAGCDWRDGACVDTLLSRQKCSAQRTATDCAAATGLNPMQQQQQRNPFAPPSPAEVLFNPGDSNSWLRPFIWKRSQTKRKTFGEQAAPGTPGRRSARRSPATRRRGPHRHRSVGGRTRRRCMLESTACGASADPSILSLRTERDASLRTGTRAAAVARR